MADLLEIIGVLRYVKATSDSVVKIVSIPFDHGCLSRTATPALPTRQATSHKADGWFRHFQRGAAGSHAGFAPGVEELPPSTSSPLHVGGRGGFEDHGNCLASMLSEMVYSDHQATMREQPAFKVIPVTDARSLWDAVHRLSTNFQEKRVEIDVAALRQSCRLLRWVPAEVQKTDAVMNRSRALRDEFRHWMAAPTVALTESRSPENLPLPSEANAAWR